MLYLTLRQYEYVVAVANSTSMSAAADRLNVSQPALSVAVQTVETRLGKPLFVRQKGSPVRPTLFGREFLKNAEQLLAHAARLEDPKGVDEHVLSRLRIGCFTDLAPLWLAPLLKKIKRRVPNMEITHVVAPFEDLEEQLSDGDLDLAITYDLGLDARFKKDTLCHASPGAFVAIGHDLACRSEISLKELASHPLILFEEGPSIQHMLSLFSAQGLNPRINHKVDSLEVMRSFAANGEGVGLSYTAPPGTVSYDRTEVVRIPISEQVAVEPIVVAYLLNALDVAPTTEVLALIRELGDDFGKITYQIFE